MLDTLEQLDPGSHVSRNDREWRPYGILTHRYVDGYEIDDIVTELRTSLRQFQRDHRKGLLAMASILWPRWQAVCRDADREDATDAPVDAHIGAPTAAYAGLHSEMEPLGLAVTKLELSTLLDGVLAPARLWPRSTMCGSTCA